MQVNLRPVDIERELDRRWAEHIERELDRRWCEYSRARRLRIATSWVVCGLATVAWISYLALSN